MFELDPKGKASITGGKQAGNQMLALLLTLAFAIVGGVVTGFILKIPIFGRQKGKKKKRKDKCNRILWAAAPKGTLSRDPVGKRIEFLDSLLSICTCVRFPARRAWKGFGFGWPQIASKSLNNP